MAETAAPRKKWELTFSVQSRAYFSLPMGTEEEPNQQPCQRHGQLRPVYLGYFEGEEAREYSDLKRGSDCEHLTRIRPGISLAKNECLSSFQISSLASIGINMAKRCSQNSLASSNVIVRESNKPVHAANADTGRSDTANR
jgi:hypothetical protein